MMNILYTLAFITVIMSVYMDYKKVKIKNILTLPIMIIGLILNGFRGELMLSLLGIVVPFGLLYVFWKIKGIGAGDVKLLMAIGSLVGIRELGNATVVICGVLLIQVIYIEIREGVLISRFKELYRQVKYRDFGDKIAVSDKGTIKLGYAICIGYCLSFTVFHIANQPFVL